MSGATPNTRWPTRHFVLAHAGPAALTPPRLPHHTPGVHHRCSNELEALLNRLCPANGHHNGHGAEVSGEGWQHGHKSKAAVDAEESTAPRTHTIQLTQQRTLLSVSFKSVTKLTSSPTEIFKSDCTTRAVKVRPVNP